MLENLTEWGRYRSYVPPNNTMEGGQGVKFTLTLDVLEELDEKKQRLTSLVSIYLTWLDERLVWNPSHYGGVDKLVTREDRLWKPNIICANRVAEIWDHMPKAYILHSTGSVSQIQQKRYLTTCPLDFRKFPFDEQKCDLYFMEKDIMDVWKIQMNLTTGNDPQEGLDNPMQAEHPVWDLTGISAKTFQHKNRDKFTEYIRYTFNLKRRGHYYTYMFVTPAVMLALLTPVLFLMPTEGTVRFTLGGALLISISVMLLMLEQELPATHNSVPALGVYYVVTFVLVCLSLVLGTLTYNISTKSVRLNHPPTILKTMLLSFVARLLCVPYDKKYGVGTTDVALEETGKQDEADPQTEWRLMAMVLDRILFIIFFVVIVITSFALLL